MCCYVCAAEMFGDTFVFKKEVYLASDIFLMQIQKRLTKNTFYDPNFNDFGKSFLGDLMKESSHQAAFSCA